MSKTNIANSVFSVVAFYGIAHTPNNCEAFYRVALKSLQVVGCQSVAVATTGSTFSTTKRKFTAKIASKLEATLFEGFDSLELYGSSSTRSANWLECDVGAYYESSTSWAHAYFMSNSVDANLDSSLVATLCCDLTSTLQPTYGIGYQRLRSYGPGFYASGISCAPIGSVSDTYDRAESLRINKWRDYALEQQPYRHGLLRDIYPLNLLNETQLNNMIEGTRLQQWITDGHHRGRISKLSDKLTLWLVCEEDIPLVRTTLCNAGLLFGFSHDSKKIASD